MEHEFEEMLEHTKMYVKEQTNLSLKEAITISKPGATLKYVLSEAAVRSTRGYHKGNDELVKTLFSELQKQGYDAVDDCMEDIYKCVMNIDGDGDDLFAVSHAKECLNTLRGGILKRLGFQDGVLGKQPNVMGAFTSLCKKHGLI